MQRTQRTQRMQQYVLVVEDDPEFRSILASVMRWEGYDVLTAGDGGAALDLMRVCPAPLVVTLDLRMPQQNGLAVLEAVAADAALAQRHAIVLATGAVGEVMHSRVQALCDQLAIPLVWKPFDVRQLLDAVAAAQQRLAS